MRKSTSHNLHGKAWPNWKQRVVIGLSEALKSQKPCQIVVYTPAQAKLVGSIIQEINTIFHSNTAHVSVKIASRNIKRFYQIGSLLYND